MDPHSDVKSDVDYQAVLSHMNINKGWKRKETSENFIRLFSIDLDQILHHNESTSFRPQTARIDENEPDRASLGCKYFSD